MGTGKYTLSEVSDCAGGVGREERGKGRWRNGRGRKGGMEDGGKEDLLTSDV
jgi:hypothetical protein